MGTLSLLKCYKPFFSTVPRSARPLLSGSPIFRTNNNNNFNLTTLCLCSSLGQSQPLTEDKKNLCKSDGHDHKVPLPEVWLHNTMSRKKDLLKPKEESKVKMYVCGVTAYDLSHIGHARVYINFDILYRYLEHLGYEVRYVRNFTDIDDKIIKRAKELGEDPISLSRHYSEVFRQEMIALNCLPPSVEPKVSEHIPQIIDMIEKILNNGYAYIVDGDVYFIIEKIPDYGKLDDRDPEDNRAGERVEVDPRKKNPADFALWKSAKPGEPVWESPWGPGRPGWHIECSAMSAAYLGYSFDIHGGGDDLKFPHHENERVQNCAACSESDISLWIHNGLITVDRQKMSKSLGNFVTIQQVLEDYHPLALRYFLTSAHYRSAIDYSRSNIQLESASDRLFYIYETLHECESFLNQHDQTVGKDSIPAETMSIIDNLHNVFWTSMSDDVHTPVVLSGLSDPLKSINDLLHSRQGKKQKFRVESLAALEKSIRNVLTVLGLLPTRYLELLQQLREKALKRANLTEAEVLQKIEERAAARIHKEYARSDAIRKDLADVGITLMDGPNGTAWRPAIPLRLQEQHINAP